MQRPPYLFDEFFASGKEESISPFLTPRSRKIAKNLSLKTATLSAGLLILSFVLSFYSFDISRLVLVFVYLFAGVPALIETVEDLCKFEINIDVLMTLAAFLAILIGSELEGALLLVLFAFSGALEESVSAKAKATIQSLGKISPTMAHVLAGDGSYTPRSVREIPLGTKLLVKAGEIIPLDGKITAGDSFVNLSHLTGESAPMPKTVGDDVQAGGMNLDGTLTIEVTRISADSTLSRIIDLISRAQESKPKLERLFDRFSKIYSTTIILLALLFALILPYLFSIPFLGLEGSIYRALTFLIAASPCALIIATPTAYLSAINACAKHGIILKGGFTLDALASCTTFAFDKTGTLTTGNLSLNTITPLSDEALAIAASLERGVLHPMAEAITQAAQKKNIEHKQVEKFKAVPGYGLQGKIGNQVAYIGHLGFMKDKISPEKYTTLKNSIYKEAALVTLLLVDDSIYVFHFTDEVRPEMPSVLEKLQKQLQVLMLTGDHELSAKQIAETLHIKKYFADLRPDDKLRIVEETPNLAMIGDGINDAPALARATVGISMGKIGSRTAVEASDIVILNDDLTLLSYLAKKAKKTVQIVRQNLFLALGVILMATTPALLGFIPLWLAVILHEGGTVLVGFNSLRLLK